MKMDKETLSKNGFWFGLGGFGVLWLVGILALEVWGGDKGPKDTYEKAKTAIVNAQKAGPKTPAYQEPWKKYGKLFSDHKDVAWARAWAIQKDIWFWPDQKLNARLLYPDDEFGDDERLAYRDTLYKTQFDRKWLRDLVAPAEMDVSTIVPRQTWDQEQTPTKEECWLAQEDFCVRLQVLKDLRTAMDAVARFEEVKVEDKKDNDKEKAGKDEKPTDVKAHKRFRNRLWEIDLLLVPNPANPGRLAISEKSTIKNIHPDHRTQPLANPRTHKGLAFRLTDAQNPQAQFNLEVAGEPVAYGKAVPLRNLRKEPIPVRYVNLARDFTVTQVFEWETSPIRRIEALELGYHSHRTCTTALTARPDLKALDPQPKDEKAAEGTPGSGPGTGSATGGGPSGGPAGGGGMMMGGAAGGPPGMGGAEGAGGAPGARAADVTPVNKINRARYVFVTPQARHLPLAMRLVVDQSNIQDVLVALANSPLRIQVTQVELHHRRDVKGAASDSESGGIFPTGPPAGGRARGGPRGGVSPGGYGGATAGYGRTGGGGGRMAAPEPGGGTGAGRTVPPGTGRGSPEGTGPSGPGGAAAEGAPLMELTVYGIAVLYDRFPPKKKDTPGGSTPAAGGTPAAGSPPAGSPPAVPPPAGGAPKDKTPTETPKGGTPGGTTPTGGTPAGGTPTTPDKPKGTTPPGPGR